MATLAMIAVGKMMATTSKGMASSHHTEKRKSRAGGFNPTISLE